MMQHLLTTLTLSLTFLTTLASTQPNILWITSEDNSPYLGCYNDPLAQTPNLDQLASEGVRYLHAFANAPVCSAARSTLITGMYAPSLGIHNHRSKIPIPSNFQPYPAYLKAAGYYCSNNSKTDYNFPGQPQATWDDSSPTAHYQNRQPGQPFFAVFNLTTTHESQVQNSTFLKKRSQGLLPPTTRIPPSLIQLPPYHPDTPEIREDWARYYDTLTLLDQQVAHLLLELQQANLADNTIVFYFSDHGGALPRGKRNLHDSGTRVPLILRFPEKLQHLAPALPGESIHQPVSFVDITATLLSLAHVPIPAHFQGRAFAGPQAAPPQDHVLLFRDRMDERCDTARAVRTQRYRYIRNYSPHLPWGQHYSYPFEVLPSMRSWHQAFTNQLCNSTQARYWLPKPPEELYDLQNDPHEIHNLAQNPQHTNLLQQLRHSLNTDLIQTRDTGFIPESMFPQLTTTNSLYHYAQGPNYPIHDILHLANLASDRNPNNLPQLITATSHPHPVMRYWATQGLLFLQHQAKPATPQLTLLLHDPHPAIQIAAAQSLAHCNPQFNPLTTLTPHLSSTNESVCLAALNTLDSLHQNQLIPTHQIQPILQPLTFPPTPNRIAQFLLQ